MIRSSLFGNNLVSKKFIWAVSCIKTLGDFRSIYFFAPLDLVIFICFTIFTPLVDKTFAFATFSSFHHSDEHLLFITCRRRNYL